MNNDNTDTERHLKNRNLELTFILTIITTVFSFLYLIIVFSFQKKSNTTERTQNSFFSGIFFNIVIFVLLILCLFKLFFQESIFNVFIIVCFVLIFIYVGISTFLNFKTFSDVFNNSTTTNNTTDVSKHSLLILFGIIISGFIIFWIVKNIENKSKNSTIISSVLIGVLVVLFLGLIYKTIFVQIPVGNSKKNAFFTLVLQILLYIPCLFSGVFDKIGKSVVGEYNSSTMGSLIMLGLALILFVVYFKVPSLFNFINVQGGKQLVNKPVYTDTQYQLGTYQELNGSEKMDYQFAISFWFFLDAVPPNTTSSFNKFTSLLNFGEKPNILYNGKTNTLMVTIQQKDLKKTTPNRLTDFDENDNRILYKNKNVLLQKWNNLIINSSGGVLDIFLNGELVKSDIGVVPYFTFENLTIGENDGIKGGICNVIYFSRPLNTSNIYYIYNLVKNKSPPVLNTSNKTILTQNLSTLNSSI
jgi:hypothetical protein